MAFPHPSQSVFKGKYLDIYLVERRPKTEIYEVRAKEFNVLLGRIKWFPRWRKYALFVEPDMVFEESCLKDIIKFLEWLKEDRRIRKIIEMRRVVNGSAVGSPLNIYSG